MNKGDTKTVRRLRRKVKKLTHMLGVRQFQLDNKDKRISSLESTINDLEEKSETENVES
jgi:polyhydroxyalkanoate synthesis regulator phasin